MKGGVCIRHEAKVVHETCSSAMQPRGEMVKDKTSSNAGCTQHADVLAKGEVSMKQRMKFPIMQSIKHGTFVIPHTGTGLFHLAFKSRR